MVLTDQAQVELQEASSQYQQGLSRGAEATRLRAEQRMAEAEAHLEELSPAQAAGSRALEIQGTIHFLRGAPRKALETYEQALHAGATPSLERNRQRAAEVLVRQAASGERAEPLPAIEDALRFLAGSIPATGVEPAYRTAVAEGLRRRIDLLAERKDWKRAAEACQDYLDAEVGAGDAAGYEQLREQFLRRSENR